MDQVTRSTNDSAPGADGVATRTTPYALYVAFVLLLVSMLCYIDRTIISAVAENLKQDMGLTDAQLGFLFGTSFSVLFAIVGFPIGRLSDVLPRTKLMGLGLFFWSLMTMLAGFAANFAVLAATRVGLGLGEATANPCSHSLISQYFPKETRGRALSVYLVGISLGTGSALYIGGWIVQHWAEACYGLPFAGACGLAPWRAAMLIVGLPGLVVALMVATLREPARPPRPKEHVAAVIYREFSASLPPLTVITLAQLGGRKAVIFNLGIVALIALAAMGLTAFTGDAAQWIALGFGVYALFSWAAVLKLRDRPLYSLTYGDPTFVLTTIGFMFVGCIHISVQFWSVPYAIRVLGIPPAQAGLIMGLSIAAAAAGGALLGGVIADWWRKIDVRAPLWIGILVLVLKAPFIFFMFTTQDKTLFFAFFLIQSLIGGTFSPGAAVLAQELVLVRMRGTAAACMSLAILLFSLAFGPYLLGKISTITGSLGAGILSAYALAPISIVCLVFAARRLPKETEAVRRARAESFGEPKLA